VVPDFTAAVSVPLHVAAAASPSSLRVVVVVVVPVLVPPSSCGIVIAIVRMAPDGAAAVLVSFHIVAAVASPSFLRFVVVVIVPFSSVVLVRVPYIVFVLLVHLALPFLHLHL